MLQASAEIMRLLAQLAPGCAFEKASIDEAYLDVTALAVRRGTCTSNLQQPLAAAQPPLPGMCTPYGHPTSATG